MPHAIPTTIGLLLLSAAAIGCSDAKKVADAYEKICKANCECPESLDDWNEVKNCETACEGYAKTIEAEFADRESEPCDGLGDILKKMKQCAKNSCDSLYECVYLNSTEFEECWPGDDTGGGYYTSVPADEALAQIPRSIPRPLLQAAIYSAHARGEPTDE